MTVIDRTGKIAIARDGRFFDVLNPVVDADFYAAAIQRLNNLPRYGGTLASPSVYSVYDHCVSTAFLLAALYQKATLIEVLAAYHHDFHEGFLGFDCPSPLKLVLPLAKLERAIDDALAIYLAIPDLPEVMRGDAVKHCDKLLLIAEAERFGLRWQNMRAEFGVQDAELKIATEIINYVIDLRRTCSTREALSALFSKHKGRQK